MNAAKRKKLEKAGWSVGSASDFLELSEAESTVVEIKIGLTKLLKDQRKRKRVTQIELAKRIGSSQSRIAKIESADRSVSIKLIVKSLVSLGASLNEIGGTICAQGKSVKVEPSKPKSRKALTA